LTYFLKACEATKSIGVSNTTFAGSRQKNAYVTLPHSIVSTSM
jgi:hypothetical protein